MFDYQNNRLYFEARHGFIFDLQLRSRITIITGASATGKTLLFDSLYAIKRGGRFNKFNMEKIHLFTVDNQVEFPDEECLVIIDRGDIVIDDSVCQKIMDARKAHFLLFLRSGRNLHVPPSQFGEFVRNDKMIHIQYAWDTDNWG